MKDRSGNCALCGTFRNVLDRDHKVPKAMGGSNEPSNIQLICQNCHQDKTREDLKKMKVGERCKKGRTKAALLLTDDQKKARKKQAQSNGLKSAAFMKSMTDEQRLKHGEKVKNGYLKMPDDEKVKLRHRLKQMASKAGLASKEVMSKLTTEERKSLYGHKSKIWHDSLSNDGKLQLSEKIKSGIKNESDESRQKRINGSKKAASRFALMTDSERKEWGAKCLAGRLKNAGKAQLTSVI